LLWGRLDHYFSLKKKENGGGGTNSLPAFTQGKKIPPGPSASGSRKRTKVMEAPPEGGLFQRVERNFLRAR